MTTHRKLSALALTQLRLDVEEASRKAGKTTGCPIDYHFFDPLEESEESLEGKMSELNLANEFGQLREAAAGRFPLGESDEYVPAEDRFERVDWHGIKGLFVHSTLWSECAMVSETELQRFSAAVGISQDLRALETYEKLAQRLRLVEATLGFSDFRYWAMFAVCESMDNEQFDHFINVASDMGLMFAKELARHLHAEPLEARIKRKAESGGAPSVVYQAIPVTRH
jgi:hypothetical protein